jgi:hypothetical protein
MTSTRLIAPLAGLLLVLAGCVAGPAAPVEPAPETSTEAPAPAPDPKPTAAMTQDQEFCYADLLNDPATEEHHGGDVPWPAPLTDDDFPIEPSCWYNTDQSGSGSFAADWRVLGPTEHDALLTAIQDALAAGGLSVSFTGGDGNGYHIDSYVNGDVTIELRYSDDFAGIELDTVPTA